MNIATVTSDFIEKSRFVPAIFIIQYISGTATKGKGSRFGLPFVMAFCFVLSEYLIIYISEI